MDCSSEFTVPPTVSLWTSFNYLQMITLKVYGNSFFKCEVVEPEEGEFGYQKWPLPSCLLQKSLTALLILESVIRCSAVDNSVVKAMDSVKEFVSRILKD
jgi:hypothetical protein